MKRLSSSRIERTALSGPEDPDEDSSGDNGGQGEGQSNPDESAEGNVFSTLLKDACSHNIG